MAEIKLVSHQSFDDPYTKELVYLDIISQLNNVVIDKFRVAYVRKQSKNGGLFWSPVSVGVTINGKKEYFEAFSPDSNNLTKDIKDLLEKRRWESKALRDEEAPF